LDRGGQAIVEQFIAAQGLSKTYSSARGAIEALKDVNVVIPRGQFVSLVGPSGCGKSTLLRCIAGLEQLSAGTLAVDGTAVREPPDKLGIVFQRDVLLDWRTVLENVLLPIEFRNLPPRQYRERAMQLLEMIGLKDFTNRHPYELSGGMRQRVAICRALIEDPSILLMDEPFAALDAFTRDELNLELQKMWLQSPKTVIFVTHNIGEAVFLGDRVLVMARRPGRIAADLEVNLPRPRPLALRDTPDFIRYSAQIRETFEGLGEFRKFA
jgi:NitT/TauT family transport system ATP-binding protein